MNSKRSREQPRLPAALRRAAERQPPTRREEARLQASRLIAACGGTVEGLAALLRSGALDERAAAAEAIGYLGWKRLAPHLVVVLGDPSEDRGVRKLAAWSLGILGSKRTVPRLIALLRAAPDASVREDAAYALGWLGDPAAIGDLEVTLRDVSEPALVRAQAAEALGLIGERGSVPVLLEALAAPEVDVRFWAAYALGQIGDAAALPALRRAVETDHATVPGWWSVAAEAADAIRILAGGEAEMPGLDRTP